MLRGIFVTGTDTNVGKTVVSAALMRRYRERTPGYWKPIQTGIEQDDDSSDVMRLSGCAAADVHTDGVRLPRPLSPHRAAELAGTAIELSAVTERLVPRADTRPWVVEGAGGVLVPLNDRELMIDLIARLALPTLVVARSSLGTINHTLLTLEALGRRAVSVAGVVMVGEPNASNRAAIERFGHARVVGEMPRFEPLTQESLSVWAEGALDADGCLAEYLR